MPVQSRLAVEAWAEQQEDKPSLSEAIRRLVDIGLAATSANKPPRKKRGAV
jgi:hypothetical protein